jgi:Ca2+-binding EF-hand superfamily protein
MGRCVVGRSLAAAAVGLVVCAVAGGRLPLAAAQSEPAPPGNAPPPAPPPAAPRRGLGGLLDRAGDRLRAEAMKRFDRNGDGQLDDAERAEALDTLKQKGGDLEGQARALLLARFDADSSGTLDDAERKTALTEIMTQVERNGPLVKSTILGPAVRRFDIDGNGTLDAGERAALGDEVARRWLGQPAGEPARRVVTREALRKTLLDRFDTDQDGRFDTSERSAAVAEIESILDGGEPDGGDRAVSRITPPSARPSSPP